MTPEQEPSREELERRIQEREKRIAEMKAKLGMAESFERTERMDRVATGVRLTAIGIGLLVLLAGGAWGLSKLSDLGPEECRFHEHATFRVYEHDEELGFKHSRFDMRNMAMRAHLHQPNDYLVHLEGACASVADFFSLMGMKLEPGYLRLDKELHDGRELRDDGNNTLQFYLYHNVEGNWTWEPYQDLPRHQLRDQQRMLAAYGNYTSEEVSIMQARVPQG